MTKTMCEFCGDKPPVEIGLCIACLVKAQDGMEMQND